MNEATGAPFRIVPGGIELTLRATPRGGRDALEGVGVDAAGRCFWQVRVRVAPEEGAANRAVIALVAGLLDIPARDIRLVAGETARIKRLKIDGNSAELAARARAATDSLTRPG
ncbi:DUF167 family protein [Rhabdaerophilum sp. SD176]|uniref:DUF167 family protein n=1 Tax=Rhabdaerophilum sp. SD176 TaxID=2983548 RepID=UPI0024DF35BB|nr:DUF167 family protein [Rhabdaerophilum sp. SD176]